jgi:hypothetical protein
VIAVLKAAKTAAIYIGILAMFALMVTDPYLITWGLIIFAVIAGTASWSKRFR